MAVTLTSDALITEQLVAETAKLTGDQARLYINAVSALFLRYTGRSRINSGAVVQRDKAPPPQVPVLWLTATPVSSVTSIKIYSGGVESYTLDTEDYVLNTDTGRLVINHQVPGYPGPEQVIVSSYTGGWTTVPGDVQQTALEMVRLQHSRLAGRVGVTSESREGFSATYDQAAIPQSVAGVWRAYKVY